jgi:hypothetical protein
VIDIGRRCQASLEMQRMSTGSPDYDRLPIYGTVLGDLFGIRHPLAAGKVMSCPIFALPDSCLTAHLRFIGSV